MPIPKMSTISKKKKKTPQKTHKLMKKWKKKKKKEKKYSRILTPKAPMTVPGVLQTYLLMRW